MTPVPALLAFFDLLDSINPFLAIVVIAFVLGVAAPWALWTLWRPKKTASKRDLRNVQQELLDLRTRQVESENLRDQHTSVVRQLEQSREQMAHYAERERRVFESEGRIWERPADGQVPPFRLLESGMAPIIC